MEKLSAAEILEHALRISEKYEGNLTLRQLYYRFVAETLVESSQDSYTRIGDVLTSARLAGKFPLDWLMDRTREAKESDIEDETDVDERASYAVRVFRSIPKNYVTRGRWVGQPNYVTVGIEKEALAGVFEELCEEELGVGLFVFRGYPSVSSIWQWLKHYHDAYQNNADIERCVFLYFGDHDPDGLQIPFSFLDIVNQLVQLKRWKLPPVEIDRRALTVEQIEEYQLPPFPAKESSPRFKRYVEKTGLHDAWEVDALLPETLQEGIEEAVDEYFDHDVHDANQDIVERARDDVWDKMLDPEFIEAARRGGRFLR